MSSKARSVIGPDGIPRHPDKERRINSIIASVLGTAAGKEVLNYLKSITTERVCGWDATDGQLRHLEGQRFIVGILSQRVKQGEMEKANAVPDKTSV